VKVCLVVCSLALQWRVTCVSLAVKFESISVEFNTSVIVAVFRRISLEYYIHNEFSHFLLSTVEKSDSLILKACNGGQKLLL